MSLSQPAGRMSKRIPAALSVTVAVALTLPSASAQVPRSLSDLIMGASQRPVIDLEHAGQKFQGMRNSSDFPFLMWPDGRSSDVRGEPAHEREATRRWLRELAPLLGHRDFVPRFESVSTWRDNEVWNFGLTRAGLELYDARVQVHWQGERWVGLVNLVPLPLLGAEEPGPQARLDGSLVYHADRSEQGYRAVVTRRQVRVQGGNRVTTVGNVSTYAPISPPPAAPIEETQFRTWPIPIGTFPDQLDVDSNGNLWFSQPNDNWLTRFHPGTETFTQFATTGGSGPDGMMVDSQDRVWTGLYFSNSGLGVFDQGTGVHTTIPPSYTPAAMAIPVESSTGTIWVTDHQNNRISEWDPVGGSWLNSLIMPSPGAWVVEGDLDPTTGTIWYSCYSIDKLAFKPVGQAIQETATPPGGPAFPVWSQGKIYYSLWNDDALGCYDPVNDTHTLYQFPIVNEVGGPIGATEDGRIVVGTRTLGYIMVFNPATVSFKAYDIPNPSPGLKDGLNVGPDGTVWYTETFANYLSRLVIP